MHAIRVPTQLALGFVLMSFLNGSKPYDKQEQAVWRLECEMGVIADADCPVDGGWAPWQPWAPCRCACDSVGHRRRTRTCTNPPPSADGLPCEGPEEQIQQCYKTNCTVEDFRRLVQGDTLRMEAFRQLEIVPSLMERCLKMECPYETIETILSSDNTWQANPETTWDALQCIKHNTGCPVVGEWGSWGEWSACGARCGRGLRWRFRRCDTPAPSHAHLVCSGTPLQAEECSGDRCAIDVQDGDNDSGRWSAWDKWSVCSDKCGSGVRRRQRLCQERIVKRVAGDWGTRCVGQHDQFEVCENDKCTMDGGWSGWSTWGPCSQTCGAGRRFRTRSCTRPAPSGDGFPCTGPKNEFSSCYLSPCEVFSHRVAVMNGDSYLQYDFKNKRSMLFHFYVRFMPLSPHGTLVRRGSVLNPLVRLSLQKWHICVDASGTSSRCTLPRLCSPSAVDPAVWHTALVTVTGEEAALRLDDAVMPIRSVFSCDPELPDENVNIFIGERLHGEIQDIILNFIPLSLTMGYRRSDVGLDFSPTSASNVVYEKADLVEGYLELINDHYIRMPCFNNDQDWLVQLTIKPKRDSGTLLFLWNELGNSWLHASLEDMRLKLKLAVAEYRSDSISSSQCPPDEWLDVTLTKRRETGVIEASINSGERLHVIIEEEKHRKRRRQEKYSIHALEEAKEMLIPKTDCKSAPNYERNKYEDPEKLSLCNDEFFVGGVPNKIKEHVNEEFNYFFGTIASLSVNGALQDLQRVSVERFKNDVLQLSSRTASVSGSYHETAWGKSHHLNLTCLHARSVRSPHEARWLFLDIGISGIVKDKTVRSVDDGKVLRLVASADDDLRGFYTCRSHTFKRTLNVVTYGVIGQVKYDFTSPDIVTAIAVVTTVALVLSTLGWLVVEGINDLRSGFGFFRDVHMSTDEEVEAVCAYIDRNVDVIGSKNAAEIAKARARKRGRQLSTVANFARRPHSLVKIIETDQLHEECIRKVEVTSDSEIKVGISSESEPEGLPALPESTSPLELYRCDQSYVSSPRHGSNITSARTKLESSSSFEMSPRVLCSRLLLARRINSPRDSLTSRCRHKRCDSSRLQRSNLLTIKSSTFIRQSPAFKILERFRKLQHEDP